MVTLVRPIATLAALALLAAGLEQEPEGILAPRIQDHIRVLALDLEAGAQPGARGSLQAAGSLADRFQALSLHPVDGSYFQAVPLLGITSEAGAGSLGFESGDRRIEARESADLVAWADTDHPMVQLAGEMVFAGYGIDAPPWNWDDFKGRDLRGRILLVLAGEPPAPPDEPRLFDGPATTRFAGFDRKLQEARDRGAAGLLVIHDDGRTGPAWVDVQERAAGERLVLDAPAGEEPILQGWITQALARVLLAEAGLDLDELSVLAARRDFRPVPTGVVVRARLHQQVRRLEARNVVAHLPGRDPALADDVVVVAARYDDQTGAAALLLEVAGAFARLPQGSRRSILFLATTGGEAGALGASHYAGHPAFPLEHAHAVLEIGPPTLDGDLTSIRAAGALPAPMAELLARTSRDLGLEVRHEADTAPVMPGDHLPFLAAGAPAISIRAGDVAIPLATSAIEGAEDVERRLAGAVRQARLVFDLARHLADTDPETERHARRVPAAPSVLRP
jgi:hypothetical protein